MVDLPLPKPAAPTNSQTQASDNVAGSTPPPSALVNNANRNNIPASNTAQVFVGQQPAATNTIAQPVQPPQPTVVGQPSISTSSTPSVGSPTVVTTPSTTTATNVPLPTSSIQPTVKPAPAPNSIANAGNAGQAAPTGAASSIAKPNTRPSLVGGNNPIVSLLKKWWPVVGAAAFVLLIVFLAWKFLFNSSSNSVPTPQSGQNANPGATGGTPTQQVNLTYWGLWEDEAAVASVLQDFEKDNPGVLVSYVKNSPRDYRERLQAAITSGQGPDIFRFHASWVPMLKNNLAPLPSSVFTPSQFQQNFYPLAYQQLQANGQIVGVPLGFDTLLLYYNEEILSTAGIMPPQTWAELREAAIKLTVSEGNTIQRGGVALGNASNVDHFSDIIGLLMLQNGANPADPTSQAARDAMTFYTNFVRTDKVWGSALPSSTVAFARGEVAMMFAPSWKAHEVKQLNPQLKFAVTTVPQLSQNELTWGTYWAEGVNASSSKKDAAFKLIQYLSTPDTLRKLYAQQAETRSFGEPYPRPEMAGELSSDPYVGQVLKMANRAQNWYLNSQTFDNGLNDQLIKYYQDAVNDMVAGRGDVANIMNTVALGTNQVLRQFGLATGGSTTSTGGTQAPAVSAGAAN